MPVTSYEVHTFKCSIPKCKTQCTVAGNRAELQKRLESDGWSFESIRIMGLAYDLCPNHTSEVEEFFGKSFRPGVELVDS